MNNINVNKRLGTSLLTIFIIALGLFLVCGVKPPQPAIEDSAMEGSDFGDNALGDDDLAAFLDEETEGAAASENSDNSGLSDDLFAENSGSSGSTQSGDSDMNDILQLLDSGESTSSDDDLFSFDDSGFDSGEKSSIELASVSDLTSSASSSEEADQFEGALSDEQYEEMEKEAGRLSGVLTEKTEEADSLKNVLESYDEKIAVMELENSGVGQQYQPTYSSTQYSAPEASSSSANYHSEEYAASASETRSSASVAPPKKASVSRPKKAGFNSNYDTALSSFNSGEYTSAVKKFEELLEKEPEHKLADDCQYWLGECFMAMRDYTRAIIEYEKVFSYDDIENADAAQFKIGLSFLESGNRKMAKYELDSMLNFYAESELARKARTYLQRL